MPGKKIDFDTVRGIALGLSGVEESTAYGSPAFKVGGKLLACIAINKSAEPGTLAVCVDFERRAELMAAAPDVYYVTDHYEGHPTVLVRMSRIHGDALRDLIGMAWHYVTAQTRASKGGAGKRKKGAR